MNETSLTYCVFTGVASPTDQRSRAGTPVFEHYGMREYSNNVRVFSDGFQIVVNLSSRELTPAETSLLLKGLSFCPAVKEIDTFSLTNDVSDCVRRLR